MCRVGRTRLASYWLAALLLALSGCGAAPEPAALDSTVVFTRDALADLAAPPSYRIGLNTEVTGTGAQIGDLSIRAAQLAIEEINAAGGVGGVPLELVVRDCQSSADVALEQYQAALASDRLVALLGPFKSAYAVRVVPAHRADALPMLIGATNATLTAQGDANLFRMRPSDGVTAVAMTAFVAERLGRRRIAIIHDSDAFGSGGADNITASLAERGLAPVAREPYRTGTRDFDALVRSVAASRPDALLIYGTNNTDVGFLLRAIRYWKLDAAIVTSPSGATTVTRNIAAEAQDGIYVATDAFFGATPAGRRFEQVFADRFGMLPDTYIAWVYDSIYLLAGALRAHGGDARALGAALRAADFAGVQGRYRFDERGEGLRQVMLVRMQAGAPELIGAYPPATGQAAP